jgi:hypothetical protein
MEGVNLRTLFYVLAAWFLFNVVFAVAMYFRPVRKPGPDSMRSSNKIPREERFPPVGKLLLFGAFLNDRLSAPKVGKGDLT